MIQDLPYVRMCDVLLLGGQCAVSDASLGPMWLNITQ